MPEHSSWLTFILAGIRENLEHNAQFVGDGLVLQTPTSWHVFEPIIASLCVVLVLLFIGRALRFQFGDIDSAVVPEERLTLRTAVEAFVGYFYDMAKGVMGADRAKKYFPVIGASALFVFCSNVLALVPGMPIPTSSLSITMGCALVVFVLFNIYGIMTQGPWNYLKHLAGPVWFMAPLLFVIELISLFVRPITLAMRLMINMSVDHIIVGIALSMVPLLLPLPVMLLGVIVILVQTLVFTLLTAIYIGLATEHEAH